MLEINTGDNRYVVAYTLKPASDCTPPTSTPTAVIIPPPPDVRRQPDILNTPRNTGERGGSGGGGIGGGECQCLCRCHHKFHFSTFRHFDDSDCSVV